MANEKNNKLGATEGNAEAGTSAAAQLAAYSKLADCWAKAETALHEVVMERDSLQATQAADLTRIEESYNRQIVQLEKRARKAESDVACERINYAEEIKLRQTCESLLAGERAENERLRNSVRNQLGDNLCWITDMEPKILPQAEFLESCRRYHAQIAGERGVFTGGRTIAQLEAELQAKEGARAEWAGTAVRLRKALDRYGKHKTGCPRYEVVRSPCNCGLDAELGAEPAAQPDSTERIAELEANEKIFRRLLWIAHSKGKGYGDDGELQYDGIDYKRTSAADIQAQIVRNNQRKQAENNKLGDADVKD